MMFPAYRHMDSHTQSFPKLLFNPHHCYPSWETVPPDMRVNTSMPPSSFGPWFHSGRNNYTGASECNNCCIHGHHPPGYYYYSPPCPHMQPPQYAYPYGAHPAYHGAFPYFISPSYPSEQPQHDYDHSQNHCCGCPNPSHACQRMDNKGVKIEEHKSEVEPKGSNSSLVCLPNHYYPAAWLPFNHTKEKEQSMNSERQPTYQNEWIPLGSNGHEGFRKTGDELETMHDKVKNPLPWPIFWIPSCTKPEQAVKDSKELNTNPETAEGNSPKLKIIPMELLDNGNHAGKPGVPEDEGKVEGRPESLSRKGSRMKTIPVKQAEESIEKNLQIEDKLKEEEDMKRNCLSVKEKGEGDANKGRTKSIPVKQVEESSEKVSPDVKHNGEDNQKNGSTKMEKEDSGAKKASGSKKLPPICLRVSPLSKKKSSNGSSPSSSPPFQNGIEKVQVDKQAQRPYLKDTTSEVPNKVFKVSNADARDEVEKQTTKQQQSCQDAWKMNDSKEALKQQVNHGNSSPSRDAETSTKSEEAEVKRVGNDGNKLEDAVRETEQCKSSEGKQEGETLSPVDAAVLIQSVYRGFDVRRWQPIQKLRKICQIRMQMEEVRKQIQDLEVLKDHQDKKKRMAVNENIMSLLLQLDTIQGMHHFVREARKSAARELISLQEKLDSLAKQTDSTKVDETSGSSAVLDNAIWNVNLEPTVSNFDRNSSQLSDYKVSQDLITMEESVQESPEQNSLATFSRYAEDEQQEEAHILKKLDPDDNMLYLANQEPSSEESAKLSVSSFTQGNPEVCFISGNESSSFSVNIPEENQVLDSRSELMKRAPLESHQRNEVNGSWLESEENPLELTTKFEVSSDEQEAVEPLRGEKQLGLETNIYPITEEDNVQEMPALALAVENEDATEKVVEVDAQINNSEEPHATDENIDHHLNEELRDTIEKNMDLLMTDPIISSAENVIGTGNVVDSLVVDQLDKDISGEEGSIKVEVISTLPEAPEKGSQLHIMTPKEEGVVESNVPKLPASEIQSAEEVTECSPLLIEVPRQTIETTSEIPGQVSSGELQGIEDECIFAEHMITAGETDASPSEEGLNSKHHDACASPRDVILRKEEIKLVKENENLKQMLENLLEEGRAQIGIIHELNGRVKDLEKKVSSHQKKARAKRAKRAKRYKVMWPPSRKLACVM